MTALGSSARGSGAEPVAVDERSRRIVAAFEPATASRAAIGVAVDVAALLGAELVAVFVEDVLLLGLSALSVVREVRMPGGASGVVDRGVIESELRGLEARARREIGALATGRGVRWSFRVVRGHVPVEVAAAAVAEGADLVIVETSTRPLASGLRLRSQARSTLERTAQSVMLLPARGGTSGTVSAVYDPDDASAHHVVRRAASLAHTSGVELRVFASNPREAERQSAGVVSPARGQVSWWPLADDAETAVPALLRATTGTLFVGARSTILRTHEAWSDIEHATCRIVVVR